MKKRFLIWALVLALCLAALAPAMAANVFAFTDKTIDLFEGETLQTELLREGSYDGDGEIVYASSKEAFATVDENGLITAVSKGRAAVTATLRRNGKNVGKATVTVNVLRAVNKVTLNTTKLSVYNPDDPAVADLLQKPAEGEEPQEPMDYQVLVVPAGTTVTLSATCTPTDASNVKVTYTSSDEGVARAAGTALKAIQRGECDLTVTSVQNPEVTEKFRVLVIQPIKKITIDAGSKKVSAGSTLQLKASYVPDNATIQQVVWSSKNEKIATVDENGVVTGVSKGYANITATAADGSRVAATVSLSVLQPVTSVVALTPEVEVSTGRTVTARAQAQPAEASDKTLTWSSSDDSIATVRGNGLVTGVRAGECMLTVTSSSNPEEFVFIPVTVSQLATKIENTNAAGDLSIKVGESVQTSWTVEPEDTTNKELTFRSNAPRVATVDENGRVTAVGRGTATITAQSKDAGKKQGYVKINVIQPVTGVSMKRDLYYIQRGWSGNVQAVVEPRNANNQKVLWSSENEGIATVRSNGTSTGSVYGVGNGFTTIQAYTDDGGFTATTRVRVGNFNGAVMVEELLVDDNNKIRITLRNMTQDITLTNVHFKIECFDRDGYPMICNKDGESTYFEGDYPYIIAPLERSVHGSFNFRNYVIDEQLGAVVLTVISWKDSEGYAWTIPESERVQTTWNRYGVIPPEGVG